MTFRGSMPSGPPFNGQQPPPQAAYHHQMYGNLPQAATPGTQYPDGAYAMGDPAHQGHQPHPLSQTHQGAQFQPQQTQHPQGYYGANMGAVNGNMHASSQMAPFHNIYAAPMPRPRQPQLQPHPQQPQQRPPLNTMQFDGQAQSHLVGQHVPTYQPHQGVQQQRQQFQRAQQLPQPLHYSPSPIPQPSPSPAVPQAQANRPSPAASTMHVASPQIAPSPRPSVQPPMPHLQSKPTPQAGGSPAVQSAPYPSPYGEPQSRAQPSPKHGVNISPALSARSSSISKKSPSVPNRSVLADQNSLLVCVAEECFSKARGNLQDVVSSPSGGAVIEYQKLIATGLSCLETVLLSNRLTPRQEAKVRLRYASILYEDTESLMEAETALSKGIKLCDKVRLPLRYRWSTLASHLLTLPR